MNFPFSRVGYESQFRSEWKIDKSKAPRGLVFLVADKSKAPRGPVFLVARFARDVSRVRTTHFPSLASLATGNARRRPDGCDGLNSTCSICSICSVCSICRTYSICSICSICGPIRPPFSACGWVSIFQHSGSPLERGLSQDKFSSPTPPGSSPCIFPSIGDARQLEFSIFPGRRSQKKTLTSDEFSTKKQGSREKMSSPIVHMRQSSSGA